MRWFATRDCKLIVLACNTATAQALEAVRDESAVPIIGVVRPGAAAAIASSARRSIGVVATVGTVRSGAYVRAVRDLDPLCDVTQQACPRLVPIVESGKVGTPEALEAVREYVAPLLSEGGVVTPVVDTLLLGCTHYPLLREEFTKVAGPGVRVVDSATTTALAVREVLASHRLLADGATPTHRVFATGAAGHAARAGQGISAQKLGDLRTSDALVHVVRAFRDASVPHVNSSVDPKRDLATLELELLFADHVVVERRLERIEPELRSAKGPEREQKERERAVLQKAMTALDAETPLRDVGLDDEVRKIVRGYRFLTL